ncbi:MAG TPA: hypothetical protein VK430_06265 [Xanthobacteraceae bacterium]|nr:hypothetical protein [Xanthobacteraceae bacterium]
MSFRRTLRFVLTAAAILLADHAGAGELAAADQCLIYGFVPHSSAYAQCRMNVRRYWTTGPCADAGFAAIHREYCHLNPPPFI